MRLIDADELIKKFKYSDANTEDENVWCATFRRMIKEQPTAYDIDKVVEELEELLNPEIEKKRCFSTSCDFDNNCTNCVLKYAIEIVKAGGNNETN